LSPVPSSLSSESQLAYAPGDVIAGKYALEELLGTGGMGAVFRARNTAIDMPVAIKLIRADLDRELLSGRLLQEARAAAKLSHPAIVRVFDVGKTDLGDPFIVMELLHGESLAQVIDREGRLSSARAVQLLLPIADALSIAHAKGFVHRDVKPDNVFIANDEEGQLQPKLVDFGIVKQEAGTGGQLTQVGAVLGSPEYMSPEQARGLDSMDLRSDVWSFSVVLYETVVGATPFESKNYNALLRMIVETEPISLREQRAADGELSAIVSKGMSKEASARWASMGHMGKALAGWLVDQGITEDACGVSLEARWLSRPTDPSAVGRVARSSSPDSWPEPPSGVRAIRRNLANAPTQGTPLSLAKTSAGTPLQKRRIYLIAASMLSLAILAIAGLRLARTPTKAPAPAPLSAAAPIETRVEPPVVPPPTPATMASEAAAAPEVTAPPLPSAAPDAAKPSARPIQKRPPEPPKPTKPDSDLISPY
jgi:serine/threonine protein kinase